MNKDNKRSLSIALIIIICMSFVTPAFAASKPALSKSKFTMYVGETYTLKTKNMSGTVKWSSSNSKVVTVNKNGKITAKKTGTANIIAKAGKKTAKCKVTVKKVTLSTNYKELKKGKSFELVLKCNAIKNVKWTTSKKSVATVTKKTNHSVTVQGVGYGSTIITATYLNKKYTCKIAIKKKQSVTPTPTITPTPKAEEIITEEIEETDTPTVSPEPSEIPTPINPTSDEGTDIEITPGPTENEPENQNPDELIQDEENSETPDTPVPSNPSDIDVTSTPTSPESNETSDPEITPEPENPEVSQPTPSEEYTNAFTRLVEYLEQNAHDMDDDENLIGYIPTVNYDGSKWIYAVYYIIPTGQLEFAILKENGKYDYDSFYFQLEKNNDSKAKISISINRDLKDYTAEGIAGIESLDGQFALSFNNIKRNELSYDISDTELANIANSLMQVGFEKLWNDLIYPSGVTFEQLGLKNVSTHAPEPSPTPEPEPTPEPTPEPSKYQESYQRLREYVNRVGTSSGNGGKTISKQTKSGSYTYERSVSAYTDKIVVRHGITCSDYRETGWLTFTKTNDNTVQFDYDMVTMPNKTLSIYKASVTANIKSNTYTKGDLSLSYKNYDNGFPYSKDLFNRRAIMTLEEMLIYYMGDIISGSGVSVSDLGFNNY